jgi:nucleoside-diphosphate-sugar epimerase
MRVAVAGGTGLVGRYVVDELAAAGQEPVVLARSRGVDLVTGAGLDAAMVGTGDGQLPTGPGPRGSQTFGEWLARNAAQGG